MAEGLYLRESSPNYQFDFRHGGKRFTGSTGHTNKKLATEWLCEFRTKIQKAAREAKIGIKEDPTLTCREVLAEWNKVHDKKSPHSIRVNRDWVLHILPLIGDVNALQVTPLHIQQIRTKYLSEPSLRNRHYGKSGGRVHQFL